MCSNKNTVIQFILDFGLNTLKQVFKNIHYAYQRATKGFCECDLYEINTHLLNLIPNMLKEYKKKNMGYPKSMSYEKWNEIIDTIIRKFEKAKLPNHYDEKAHKEADKNLKEGLCLFSKWFRDLWW